MKKIGVTTTVPLEVLIAAGYKPVDLNNMFITSKDYSEYIKIAEQDGFPQNLCAWIKGIYGVVIKNDIREIVGVMEGDCSNTKVLIEILESKGIKIHPFSYPHRHNLADVKKEIDKFMAHFNVSLEAVEKVRKRVNLRRKLGIRIDKLTYIDQKVTGFENHLRLVSFSDLFESKEFLMNFIKEAERRQPINKELKLGYIGVPPMAADIYEFVNQQNGMVTYNEVQREFSFPRAIEKNNIYEQYFDYTYPYGTQFRINELKKQIDKRNLDGIIHYTQAFCYRALEDILIKEALDIPVLNIEGDKIDHLDARTKLRLEAFLDMLLDKKRGVK